MASPSIACIGVIGKHDNPLHMSLFPPHTDSRLEFSFLLNSCLDIIKIRQDQMTVDQNLGLLHAVDERLAAYCWLTNTGIKLIVVVDMAGRPEGEFSGSGADKKKGAPVVSLRESELKPVFQALQTAYIQLLQNPFYVPDEHSPVVAAKTSKSGPSRITDKKFTAEVKRIGEAWVPGVTSI